MRPPQASAEFFGPAATPLFGWLHASATPATLGLVVCAPLGHEMLHCRRSLRVLAAAAAQRGLPCLQFDFSGCGDSADVAPPGGVDAVGEDRVARWQADIEAAIAHLQARTGVAQVAVLGVRSGLLLAAPVAARHPAVAALLALAPVVSGRRLLREWRALHSTGAQQGGTSAQAGDGGLDVAGFAFDQATCSALAAIDLAQLALPARLPVWVGDRDDLPSGTGWVQALRAAGLAVEANAAPGLPAMLDEPQRHVVPQAALQSLLDWTSALVAGLPVAPGAAGAPQQVPEPPPVAATAAPRLLAGVAAGVQEHGVWLQGRGADSGVALFGIVSEPAPPAAGHAAATPVLLLVNTGPVHHVGGHRLYVALARRLAAQGQAVLRLDLSGLGDSPPRAGQAAGVVYGPDAVADVGVAVAAAQERWPGAPIHLLGLCAGGYHALKLAVAQPGVARATIVNPLVFFWRQGMSLDARELDVQAAIYSSKWRRLDSWKRLFSGQSDLRMLARVAAGRLAKGLGSLRAGASGAALQAASAPGDDDLGRELQAAAAHGTRLQFVFSEGEPGWPLLQAQAGPALQALQARGALSVQHIPRADHTFSSQDARHRFIDWVLATR